MKKKLLSVVLIVALLMSMITGCTGKEVADTQSDTQNEATASQTSIKYDYTQELNIIDDNYRNYYEIFVGSYYDSDGDGMGDLNGVTEKLDYIEEMGFNGIWLMPIMPSPTYHKYDITDYEDIDEAYGTIDDFKNLVDECHARGIRLIIDMVMNHSSSQHPWFTEACQYLRDLPEGQEPDAAECPYVEYYHFSREQVNSTYYKVLGTDWYYEGAFWSEMPDLNWQCEAVEKEFEKISDYWIDLGVDGFRMDAAMHYEESDTAANNEILNEIFNYCKEKNPEFYMVSEVWANETTIADYYGSQTPSMFNFDAGSSEGKLIQAARNGNLQSLINAMEKYQEDFSEENEDYIDAPFLTNHDMVRVANALASNSDSLKIAAGLLMMMNGSPFVYYGEEIGMKSEGTKDENKRIPMFWSATDETGMTDGPADMDAGIESSLPSWEEQLEDETSLLNYYKRALRLRNENPEIARGIIDRVESLCEESHAAITKTYEGSTIGIIYNLEEESAKIDLSGTELSGMEIRGYLTLNGEEITLSDDTLVMPSRSICIVK